MKVLYTSSCKTNCFLCINAEAAAHSRLGRVSTWQCSFSLRVQVLSWTELSREHVQHMMAEALICEVLRCQSNDLHPGSNLLSHSADKMRPTVLTRNIGIVSPRFELSAWTACGVTLGLFWPSCRHQAGNVTIPTLSGLVGYQCGMHRALRDCLSRDDLSRAHCRPSCSCHRCR